MASNNQEQNIIHRQKFQSTTNTVEVIVRLKRKMSSSLKKDEQKFSRKCLVKGELNKMDCENEKINCYDRSESQGKYLDIEVNARNKTRMKHIKEHKFLNPDTSWGEFFDAMKEASSSSVLKDMHQVKDTIKSDKSSNDNLKVDRAIQTSLNENAYNHHKQFKGFQRPCAFTMKNNSDTQNERKPKHSNLNISQEVVSKGNQKISEDATSEDQTHSLFGVSALLLIAKLKERLKSNGDSKGSNMVEVLEAFINGKGTPSSDPNIELKNKLIFGSVSTPGYPPVFGTPNIDANDVVKKLNNDIKEQNTRIIEQQQTIKELKDLSARLLSHHEDQMRQVIKPLNVSIGERRMTEHMNFKSKTIEYERILRTMELEMGCLGEQNQRQKDLIYKLEVKLSRFEHKSKYSVPLSITSSSNLSVVNVEIDNEDSDNRLKEVQNRITQREISAPPVFDNQYQDKSNVRSKIDSDGDSAFDERLSSRATSKLSRNGSSNRRPSEQRSIGPLNRGGFTNARNLLVREKENDFKERENFSKNSYPYAIRSGAPPVSSKDERNDIFQVNLSSTQSGYTTLDASASMDGISQSHLCDKPKDLSPEGREQDVCESISVQRGLNPLTVLQQGSYISDSPIVHYADKYLESTHLREDEDNKRRGYSINQMSSDCVMESIMGHESTGVSY